MEEIVVGGKNDDISFVLDGGNCLKTVLQRISGVIKRLGEERNQNKSIQSMKTRISRLWKTLLQRDWDGNTNFNMGNVGVLLEMYLENGSIPFELFDKSIDEFEIKKFGRIEPVSTILNVIVELANTEGYKGPLASFPICNNLFFWVLFVISSVYPPKRNHLSVSISIGKVS